MPSASGGTRNWNIFRVIAGYMMLLLLWRVFAPAHEYSLRTAQLLDVAVNIGLIVGLVGTYRRPGQRLRAGQFKVAQRGVLLVGRAHRRHLHAAHPPHQQPAWWTGHLRYSLD